MMVVMGLHRKWCERKLRLKQTRRCNSAGFQKHKMGSRRGPFPGAVLGPCPKVFVLEERLCIQYLQFLSANFRLVVALTDISESVPFEFCVVNTSTNRKPEVSSNHQLSILVFFLHSIFLNFKKYPLTNEKIIIKKKNKTFSFSKKVEQGAS